VAGHVESEDSGESSLQSFSAPWKMDRGGEGNHSGAFALAPPPSPAWGQKGEGLGGGEGLSLFHLLGG